MTDRGAVNESAVDHVPAHEGLGNEEHAHHKIDAKFLEGDLLCEEEIENGECVDETSQPGDETMDPFNVEDELIFAEGHVCVDLEVFRRELVFGKFILPGLLTDGWNDSANGIPFDDGKTGTGETHKAPEDDQECHDEGKDVEPFPDTSIRDRSHYGFVLRSVGGTPVSLRQECIPSIELDPIVLV